MAALHAKLQRLSREKDEWQSKAQDLASEIGRIRNEVLLQHRKLSAKALYLSGCDKLLQELLRALSALPEVSSNKVLAKHIKDLRSHLRTGKDQQDFFKHFEEVDQGFLFRLTRRHPKLSSNDLRFLSYVYMNLDTKEISSLLNITPDATRKRRERIAVKMHIPSDISLRHYLSGI